jgi:hypothetical protein
MSGVTLLSLVMSTDNASSNTKLLENMSLKKPQQLV